MEILLAGVALFFFLAGPIAFFVALTAIKRARSLQQQIDSLYGQIESQHKRLKTIDERAAALQPLQPSVDTATGSGVHPTRPSETPHPAAPVQPPSPPPPVVARPAAPPPPLPPPASPARVAPRASSRPVAAPLFQTTASPAARNLDSLEAAIGGSWLNRIGVTLLVIGIASALGYTLTHLGPLGKSLLATTLSLGLIVAGVLLERRETYAFYGRGLLAGGWAALYATAFAVHELPATRVIESPLIGFLLLLLVGAGMVLHSLRYRNQGLTGLAYGLAYAAIVMHSISAYTLLAAAVLGLGTVLHLLRRRWYYLALGGIVATYGSLFLWYALQGDLTTQSLYLALGALAINWVVFLVADFAPEPTAEMHRGDARAVALSNAVAAGWLGYLAWTRTTAETAWQPLLVLGVLYILTSVTLRRIGRPTTHQMHTLAASLLLLLAAGKAFDRIGATWAWLIEAQVLVLIGVVLRDRFHRMLGCTLFLVPTVAVVYDQLDVRVRRAGGLFDRDRFLLTGAACGCFYLTYARLRAFISSDLDGRVEEGIRRGFSYAAFVLIVLAFWVQLPVVYVALASVVLALLLFEISAPRRLRDLRIQSHLAALWAGITCLAFTVPSASLIAGSPARLPLLIVVAMGFLYIFLRQTGGRRRVLEEDPQLRPIFSWSAAFLVALAIWLAARPVVVGPAWVILALLLVEAGIALDEIHLRRPGYVALVAACLSLVMSNLTATDQVTGLSVRAATLVPAIGAIYYLWWRLRALTDPTATRPGDQKDEHYGRLLSYLAAGMAGLFFRFEFGLDGAALRWSLAMLALFAVGYLLRDSDFRLQAYALGAAVAIRAVGFDFQHAAPVLGINGPLAVAVVGVVAFTGTGFLIRSRVAAVSRTRRPDRRSVELESWLESHGRDLMWLLGVALAALYLFRTRSGFILIVAWALEGLVATGGGFLFQSRALRLAGLGLLGITLVTTLVRAFTTFDTLGRIISFLVLGVVLLLVSFVYTRYRDRIRKVL